MTRGAGRRDGGLTRNGFPPSALAIALVLSMLARARPARAIDFYEIQIYQVETAPYHRLTLELHSNTTTTATGQLAREQMDPYQIHETLEATYGVLPWLEVGQYLCTAKMSNGNYNYAGSRSKVHFGVPQSENWPLEVGGNIYYLAKWAGIFGLNVQQIGAQQRGMTEEQFKEMLVRAGVD